MDNHLHVLVRLDPEAAARWRDEIDFTGRVFREGKAAISREVAEIFQRIGTNADSWQMRLQKLRAGRLLGRFFAASRQRLREIVDRLGLRRAVNLGGCLVTSGWHEAPCVSHFSEHGRRYPALIPVPVPRDGTKPLYQGT